MSLAWQLQIWWIWCLLILKGNISFWHLIKCQSGDGKTESNEQIILSPKRLSQSSLKWNLTKSAQGLARGLILGERVAILYLLQLPQEKSWSWWILIPLGKWPLPAQHLLRWGVAWGPRIGGWVAWRKVRHWRYSRAVFSDSPGHYSPLPSPASHQRIPMFYSFSRAACSLSARRAQIYCRP